MENSKKEIIDNVILAMDNYLTKETLEILRNVLEKQLFLVNIEKKNTLPMERDKTIDEQNRYYIELMKVSKKNLGERTKKAYTDSVMRLVTLIEKPLPKMDSIDIDEYLNWYEHKNEIGGGKKNQASTCNNERRYLSAFFTWMRKEGFMNYNPVENTEALKEIKKPIDYFKPQEMEELREGCKNLRDRALIEVLRSTGARVGEIVRLNRNDIDWSTGDILVLSEKSNKYRTLYLDETARYYLKKYLDEREDENEALFVGNIKPYERLSNDGIECVMRHIKERIGVNYRVYPHKMRKTLGMNLRNAGVDIGSIQEILGHASPDTTALYYAQSTPDTLREIRKKYA